MSDKYLLQAELEVDAKLHRGKLEEQKFDTKVKHADKVKLVLESQTRVIKPGTVRQVMFERLEEGLSTKIPKENKGYQLLLRMGYQEGSTIGKKTAGTDGGDTEKQPA